MLQLPQASSLVKTFQLTKTLALNSNGFQTQSYKCFLPIDFFVILTPDEDAPRWLLLLLYRACVVASTDPLLTRLVTFIVTPHDIKILLLVRGLLCSSLSTSWIAAGSSKTSGLAPSALPSTVSITSSFAELSGPIFLPKTSSLSVV